jgi:small subunit ribosomal protein S8
MQTDPIADMLTRIRNASRARKHRVDIPHSSVKLKIAELLKAEGFINDFRPIAGQKPWQGQIEVKLRYDDQNAAVITGIQRLSKPGMRRYMRCDEIPKVQNGLGVVIVSTSQGLMTDAEARKRNVGGEALCSVW